MPSLSFTAPTTVDEAINALARAPGLAKPLAGGTDLLVQMRSGRMRPEVIVDIKRIPDLIGIRDTGDSFVIGGATPGVMLSEHEAFSRAWPGIVEGVDLIGSQQIQGRASLVGNLCNASPAADSVPAMICARAVGSSPARSMSVMGSAVTALRLWRNILRRWPNAAALTRASARYSQARGAARGTRGSRAGRRRRAGARRKADRRVRPGLPRSRPARNRSGGSVRKASSIARRRGRRVRRRCRGDGRRWSGWGVRA